LGSFYKNKHTGTFGSMGMLSFNGNKIITTGSGGMILLEDKEEANLAKHLTTTGKLQHKWEFNHDMPAFNYRLPNLNASLGITQISKLSLFLESKRKLAENYLRWGKENSYHFFEEPKNCSSNYWLNTLLAENADHKEQLLKVTNEENIMTRPAWTPMHMLPFNSSFQKDDLKNTMWLFERIVNLPSSVPTNA
jgi:dTDP-4-amino-4,6-dideoxygalactose transaminase